MENHSLVIFGIEIQWLNTMNLIIIQNEKTKNQVSISVNLKILILRSTSIWNSTSFMGRFHLWSNEAASLNCLEQYEVWILESISKILDYVFLNLVKLRRETTKAMKLWWLMEAATTDESAMNDGAGIAGRVEIEGNIYREPCVDYWGGREIWNILPTFKWIFSLFSM